MAKPKMTHEEHRERHKFLHNALDELAADYLDHKKKYLSDSTLMELLQWSHSQTIDPTEKQLCQANNDQMLYQGLEAVSIRLKEIAQRISVQQLEGAMSLIGIAQVEIGGILSSIKRT